MSAHGVQVQDRDGARWISLDRPPLNVLDLPMIGGLADAIRPLPARRDLKVLVLRSAVTGTFSAGVEVRDHARERVPEMLAAFHAVFHLLDAVPQATLAAVDGHCLGGGCELALACDLVLASPRSRFGQPEIDVGCFPPVAAVLLPRLAGRRAYEMVLGGAPVDAAQAERDGLITRVAHDLEAEVGEWVRRLAAKSGAVLALARRALRDGARGHFGDALARSEALYREELLRTRDVDEGVRAFLEKRPPQWTDD